MILTAKLRIFPTEEQVTLLWVLSEKCRLIYNFALNDRIENWKQIRKLPKEERVYINYMDQQNQLPIIKEQYPEYKWVYSKVLQSVLRKLDANYKSFFGLWKRGDINAGLPKFKGKKFFQTLTYNQSGFNYKGGVIAFSHKHPSKTKLEFSLNSTVPVDTTIKQVEIFRDSKERWFVALNYEIPAVPYVDNGKYQAIDLGVSKIVSAVNLDSKFIQIPNRRADLYWKKKLTEVQSKRDHCKKGSNRWKTLNRKYSTMHFKCANQLRDFQHKISKKIVENTRANTIIVGKLDIKTMGKKKKGTGKARVTKARKTLNHSIQNTGSLGRFTKFLTYKAEKRGKRLIKIDESYTTQTCAKCGARKKLGLYERVIYCECGNNLDRDLNSAINIMLKFLSEKTRYEFLSQQSSVDEESFRHQWKGFSTTNSSLYCVT